VAAWSDLVGSVGSTARHGGRGFGPYWRMVKLSCRLGVVAFGAKIGYESASTLCHSSIALPWTL
jgi:hypothetical protein